MLKVWWVVARSYTEEVVIVNILSSSLLLRL